MNIFADNLTDNSSRNSDSVKTGKFLSDKEYQDVNSFIKQLEVHPDFPSSTLEEDLKMVCICSFVYQMLMCSYWLFDLKLVILKSAQNFLHTSEFADDTLSFVSKSESISGNKFWYT